MLNSECLKTPFHHTIPQLCNGDTKLYERHERHLFHHSSQLCIVIMKHKLIEKKSWIREVFYKTRHSLTVSSSILEKRMHKNRYIWNPLEYH